MEFVLKNHTYLRLILLFTSFIALLYLFSVAFLTITVHPIIFREPYSISVVSHPHAIRDDNVIGVTGNGFCDFSSILLYDSFCYVKSSPQTSIVFVFVVIRIQIGYRRHSYCLSVEVYSIRIYCFFPKEIIFRIFIARIFRHSECCIFIHHFSDEFGTGRMRIPSLCEQLPKWAFTRRQVFNIINRSIIKLSDFLMVLLAPYLFPRICIKALDLYFVLGSSFFPMARERIIFGIVVFIDDLRRNKAFIYFFLPVTDLIACSTVYNP